MLEVSIRTLPQEIFLKKKLFDSRFKNVYLPTLFFFPGVRTSIFCCSSDEITVETRFFFYETSMNFYETTQNAVEKSKVLFLLD